jgi:excisionase family DNA binding protein
MPDRISDDLMVSPDEGELKALAEIAEALETADELALMWEGTDPVLVPESLRDALERIVGYLAANASVAIQPYDEVLTTQEAADLLGVSRPHLIQLLDTEGIPYEPAGTPGKHRRIPLSALLVYRDRRRAAAVAAGHLDLMRAKEVLEK